MDRRAFEQARDSAETFAQIAQGKQQKNQDADDGTLSASIAQSFATIALANAIQNLADVTAAAS